MYTRLAKAGLSVVRIRFMVEPLQEEDSQGFPKFMEGDRAETSQSRKGDRMTVVMEKLVPPRKTPMNEAGKGDRLRSCS